MRPLLLCLLAILPVAGAASAGAPAAGRPTLWVPAVPDSAPPESEPAPVLIPGRPNPADSAQRDLSGRALAEFERGRDFERGRHPGAAVVAYRNALKLDPSLREANYRMGLLFNARGQWVEAVKCFAAEVEKHPDHAEAARELGIALTRVGDSGRAIQQLEIVTRSHPDDGRGWHALGSAYLLAGRPADAERALRRAIRLPPDDAEEHRDLGAALAASGRTAEARRAYRQALAIAPLDPATWLNLGNLERRTGQADSAMAAYRRATEADSSFALGYLAEIQVLEERGRLADEVEVYRRWLARVPAEHGARLAAVRRLLELGRSEEALALAEEGLRAAPGAAAPHEIYGMALAGRGRTREGLEQLRRAQERFGDDRAGRQRVELEIGALRSSAPDSLRAMFIADSVRAAARDSAVARPRRKR